jgi:hypothetical protein
MISCRIKAEMNQPIRNSRKVSFLIGLGIMALLLLACNLLSSVRQDAVEVSVAQVLQTETMAAMYVRQTEYAAPVEQIFLTRTYQAQMAPTETPQPTMAEVDDEEELATDTPEAEAPTETPVIAPTYTPTYFPTATVGPTNTPRPPQPTPTPRISAEMEQRIYNARVLILEDIVGHPVLVPRLDAVIERMGMNTDNVYNYHDASGLFVEALEAGEEWDLIIVATEKRTDARLAIWETLHEYAQNGTAIIVEAWYLDEISGGSIKPLLDDCGVKVHNNWFRDESHEAYNFVVVDVADNNHRLFNRPRKVNMPLIPTFYWEGDVGDQMLVLPLGHAAIIGGLNTRHSIYYGLITECLEERMVLQTFSTHDYRKTDTMNLWENYIFNTLLAHFQYLDRQP